jgi:protein phosphatase-4 regulatory subunit 3
MFNDNSIFEYILQEDIYLGVLGMLECLYIVATCADSPDDPEFPTLKASYRAFYRQFSKYRHVVNIKDEVIRHKIHQTSRLIYLKDVVLARMLDDPTFHILNSFVNFNQVDITLYIQQDDALLQQLFTDFRPEAVSDSTKDEKRRDLVLFLHQLMMMGKSIQLTHRLQLYRILIERGLLFACEWAFSQAAATILHAGAEMLTLVVEHDPNSVRLHVVRVDGPQRRPSLLNTTIQLLQTTSDSGLVVQLIDAIKALLEPGVENDASTICRVES